MYTTWNLQTVTIYTYVSKVKYISVHYRRENVATTTGNNRTSISIYYKNCRGKYLPALPNLPLDIFKNCCVKEYFSSLVKTFFNEHIRRGLGKLFIVRNEN